MPTIVLKKEEQVIIKYDYLEDWGILMSPKCQSKLL